MKINNIFSGYAFTRNPIIYSGTPDVLSRDEVGRLFVRQNGVNIFEGRVTNPIRVNLAEIIDANAEAFPEVPEDNKAPIYIVEDAGELACRGVSVWIENQEGDDTDRTEFIAIPGGLSKQNFRRLLSQGTDIFKARFFNSKGNIFFTTRTNGWRIVIKETEVAPLYFMLKDEKDIRVTELVGNNAIEFGGYENGMYALDIDALRRKFFDEFNVLSSQFDIYTNEVFACRIVIEAALAARDRYRVKFRNSLGVFEIIELVGKLTFSPSFEDDEDSAFQRYDRTIDDFQTDRERVPRKLSATISTGPKRPEEVRFLMDMLASEEVYLLGLSPLPIKVIPSSSEIEYHQRPEIPENCTINLVFADRETNIMEDIVDGADYCKPRVFSKQFTEHFN